MLTVEQEYKRYTDAKNAAHNTRMEEEDKKSREQAEQIKNYLEAAGATKFWTNDYAFYFNYKGVYCSFVNQTTRIYFDIHKAVENEIQEKMIRDVSFLRHENETLYRRIVDEMYYIDGVIDGDPVSVVTLEVMPLVRETAKKIQGVAQS